MFKSRNSAITQQKGKQLRKWCFTVVKSRARRDLKLEQTSCYAKDYLHLDRSFYETCETLNSLIEWDIVYCFK